MRANTDSSVFPDERAQGLTQSVALTSTPASSSILTRASFCLVLDTCDKQRVPNGFLNGHCLRFVPHLSTQRDLLQSQPVHGAPHPGAGEPSLLGCPVTHPIGFACGPVIPRACPWSLHGPTPHEALAPTGPRATPVGLPTTVRARGGPGAARWKGLDKEDEEAPQSPRFRPSPLRLSTGQCGHPPSCFGGTGGPAVGPAPRPTSSPLTLSSPHSRPAAPPLWQHLHRFSPPPFSEAT